MNEPPSIEAEKKIHVLGMPAVLADLDDSGTLRPGSTLRPK